MTKLHLNRDLMDIWKLAMQTSRARKFQVGKTRMQATASLECFRNSKKASTVVAK